jgi:hypothetical protein
VPANQLYFWDRQTEFKEPADSFVPQVVKSETNSCFFPRTLEAKAQAVLRQWQYHFASGQADQYTLSRWRYWDGTGSAIFAHLNGDVIALHVYVLPS